MLLQKLFTKRKKDIACKNNLLEHGVLLCIVLKYRGLIFLMHVIEFMYGTYMTQSDLITMNNDLRLYCNTSELVRLSGI